MKKIIPGLFLFLTQISIVLASPSAPVAGKDYTIIQNPPVTNTVKNKVTVTEFFWYGCPHCREFEPMLEAWIKKEGKNIQFERVPVTFGTQFTAHTQLYYTLKALGVSEKMALLVFNTIQTQNKYLLSANEQADFFSQHGIDKQKFLETFNSFSVQSQVKQSQSIVQAYQVDSVPTLIIQGKYKVNPGNVGSLSKVLEVASNLVKNIQNNKL